MTDDATGSGPIRETAGLTSWPELSAIEQSLVRGGLRKKRTAGIIQAHGMALRWDGVPGAPLTGSYSYADQRDLVPEFAHAAVGLIAQDVLTVRCTSVSYPQDSDHHVAACDLGPVLRDPATWIWNAQEPSRYWLDMPQPAHARWYWPVPRSVDTPILGS